MRLEAIVKWAKSRGVKVERHNQRRIDVWVNDNCIEECHNLTEVIEAVYAFIGEKEC